MAQESSLVENILSLNKGHWCDTCIQAANKVDLESLDIAGSSTGNKHTAEYHRFAAGREAGYKYTAAHH